VTTRDDNATDLLRGTLDLLILRTLELRPLHGLEQQEWIQGEWTSTEEGRRVKSYRLTAAGRRQLSAEKRQWARIVDAMTQVLESR